jgi:hypothetical protein
MKGDEVTFYKGCSSQLKYQLWDRIYISTLYTFHWDKTISTINFYKNSTNDTRDVFVGGIMATLMKNEIYKNTQVSIVEGLLNKKGLLSFNDDEVVDQLVPDYDIINQENNPTLNYFYPTQDSYIAYATRGCIRKCKFCAVPIIEPGFSNGISISKQVSAIKKKFGEKRHLLMLDNNILASDKFFEIIEEIKDLGFCKGAKFNSYVNGRKIALVRYIDFNQGIDARLITKDKMKKISELAINPLRIAFDDIDKKDLYIEKVRFAAEYGIKILSNYILYNYKDTPDDFYERLKINVELNDELKENGHISRIWSFPMKYSPIFGKYCINRNYVGRNWNKKQLRAIQCILNATHGVVGPKMDFFKKAFGNDIEEFKRILMLPEIYILKRKDYGTDAISLEERIKLLDSSTKKELFSIIEQNNFKELQSLTDNQELQSILNIYKLKYK